MFVKLVMINFKLKTVNVQLNPDVIQKTRNIAKSECIAKKCKTCINDKKDACEICNDNRNQCFKNDLISF